MYNKNLKKYSKLKDAKTTKKVENGENIFENYETKKDRKKYASRKKLTKKKKKPEKKRKEKKSLPLPC